MRLSLCVFVLGVLLATGCAKRNFTGNALHQGSPASAAETNYKFGFSGLVTNDATKQAISNFAVNLIGSDPSIGSVVNALGSSNGVFHISRSSNWTDLGNGAVQALITASGFEPVVQSLNVGSDCQTSDCTGSKPVSIFLKPVQSAVAAAAGNLSTQALSPSTITQLTSSLGAPAIFNQLLSGGKLDPLAATSLSSAKNSDVLSNVLVLLNGASGANTSNVVSGLLGAISNPQLTGGLSGLSSITSLIPALTSGSSPKVGSALGSANVLLNYLQPLLNGLGGSSGNPMGQIISTLTSGSGLSANLGQLLSGLGGAGGSNQLASLLPLVTGLMNPASGKTSFDSLLSSALSNPNVMGLLSSLGKTGGSSNQLTSLLTTLTPLLQGLSGSNGNELSSLFNGLVSNGGISALTGLANGGTSSDQFSKLLPFIEPIIQGLSGSNAGNLTSLLTPLLNQSNPAGALQGLLSSVSGGNTAGLATVAQTTFPSLPNLLQQAVPGKQVFTAQLLQGLLNGDLKNVQVTQDLKGVSGVVLSGQARDIFKLAQLPNVDKIIALGSGGN